MGTDRHCGECGTPLARPGDYCLVCRSANADGVVLDVATDRAIITMLDGDTVLGETTVRTTPEEGERETTERRNFAGRIVDEVRRKRPETVYMAGDRDVLGTVQSRLRYPCYRVDGDGPVEAAIARRADRALEVVEAPPAEKIGGSHSTVIGDRAGRKAVQLVAGHPHVKKVIPGPIDAGGTGSQRGLRAKATRADTNGNLRLLLRGGSSVQENRIVTTAMDRERGERVREDLNERLADAELQ